MSFKRPTSHKPAQESAKVRFRIKGESTGPVYQGQVVVVPCKSCGGKTAKVDPVKNP